MQTDVRKIITRIACRFLRGIFVKSDRLLARELDLQPDEAHRTVLIEAIRNGSLLAYGHFNLHGEFDFSNDRLVDSIGLVLPKNPPPKGP